MKVPLLHAAVLESDLAIEQGGQGKDSSAFDLRANRVRIYDGTAVNRPDDAMDTEFALFRNGDFRNMRDKSSKRLMHGDAAPASLRQRFSPTGLFSGEFQHSFVSRMFVQQCSAKFEWVLARRLGKFIHERLDHKRRVRMSDRAQPEARHASGRLLPVHQQIWNVVGNVLRAFDRSVIHAFLDEVLRKWRARDERLANDSLLPGQQLAACIQSGAHGVIRARPVKSTAHVVLARPNDFDRFLDGL